MRSLLKISLSLAFALTVAFQSDAAEKCYGLYIGDSPSGEAIAKATSLYGTPPCSILLFYDATWYPSAEQLNIIGDMGAIPIITVEPWDAGTKEPKEFSVEYIKGLTDSINAYDKEVYVRYAHEMNGNWYPWSGDPKRYIEGYRHFHDAVSAGLTNKNVKWIFSVNHIDMPDTATNRAILYYPGNEYVDLIGLDGYLNYPSWWQRIFIWFKGSFSYLFGDQIDALKGLGKPFIITETAVAGDDDVKADAIRSLLGGPVPMLVWFDIKKEADWRIASGIKSLEFFRKGIKR